RKVNGMNRGVLVKVHSWFQSKDEYLQYHESNYNCHIGEVPKNVVKFPSVKEAREYYEKVLRNYKSSQEWLCSEYSWSYSWDSTKLWGEKLFFNSLQGTKRQVEIE